MADEDDEATEDGVVGAAVVALLLGVITLAAPLFGGDPVAVVVVSGPGNGEGMITRRECWWASFNVEDRLMPDKGGEKAASMEDTYEEGLPKSASWDILPVFESPLALPNNEKGWLEAAAETAKTEAATALADSSQPSYPKRSSRPCSILITDEGFSSTSAGSEEAAEAAERVGMLMAEATTMEVLAKVTS